MRKPEVEPTLIELGRVSELTRCTDATPEYLDTWPLRVYLDFAGGSSAHPRTCAPAPSGLGESPVQGAFGVGTRRAGCTRHACGGASKRE
jgi:hypothetical protein